MGRVIIFPSRRAPALPAAPIVRSNAPAHHHSSTYTRQTYRVCRHWMLEGYLLLLHEA